MEGKIQKAWRDLAPLLLWGGLFVLVLLAFLFGGTDDGGQVCSETGVADSADYPNC